jgi:hypothetical protein
MIIKLLLLGGFAVIAVLAYRSPLNARDHAIRRLTTILLVCAAAVGVVRPAIVTDVAVALGVGRGADLVLYTIVIVSILVWLSVYRRVYDLEQRVISLTRALAIHDADPPDADVLDASTTSETG